jgi:2',3'-cyclic-nucleotide 2'-phosphodiesterase (5'-nucleotidase family)
MRSIVRTLLLCTLALISCTKEKKDRAAPVVTAFAVPAATPTLTTPITALTATDDVAVTGYLVTESATPPSASDPGWSATPPRSFTLAGRGPRTLHAWAKDAAGHVSAAATASVDATARVTVLFTTDEHSHLFATPEVDDFPLASAAGSGALVGGVARRATLLEAERAAAAGRAADTLTVSSGDFSQGTLASAAFLAFAPDLAVMKKLGYDAVALGNHEFDLGPAALAAAIGAAGANLPPLVLTNAFFDAASAADDALASLYGPTKAIAPSRVLQVPSGLKVGVVAVMGVGAGTDAAASAPLGFWDPAAGTSAAARFASIILNVQQAVTALRLQGVDAVIALGHGGIGATPDVLGEDELLAANVTGIDLVVSGHTHLSTPAPRLVQDPAGRSVPVVQAKAYGEEVGRVELVFDGGSRPALDPARTAFLRVDDRILATANPAILGVLDATMAYLEAGAGAGPSFLERALTHVEGTPVTDDPAFAGTLYFRPLCHTSFDVVGLGTGETNGMNLDTDAMLAAARGAGPTIAALQSRGSIRADLQVGATGRLTFADVYDVVPLGGDPTVVVTGGPAAVAAALTEVPGYPLVRFWLSTAELRAALEASLLMSTRDPDYFLGPSGLAVQYDPTRAPFDPAAPLGPGWVTRVATVDEAGAETGVLYDVAQAGVLGTHFLGDPTALQPVAATYYVASFAQLAGVTLRDSLGAPTTPAAAILRRGDGSAVKDHESLAAFIRDQCAANGGELPARYGGVVPRRMVPTAP